MGFWEKILKTSSRVLDSSGENVEFSLTTGQVSRPHSKTKKSKESKPKKKQEKEDWLSSVESKQLVVDVYEDEDNLIIISTVAGLTVDDIDITVEPDLVVIKGQRNQLLEKGAIVHIQECFWGKFSRTLVLPCPVKPDKAEAKLKNGILKIVLPKSETPIYDIKAED
ncbi:Hsp20/alpha crystallin family protein [bacterium]|nr:Hsp20/alpha crystallin family protein [bacterium]